MKRTIEIPEITSQQFGQALLEVLPSINAPVAAWGVSAAIATTLEALASGELIIVPAEKG